MSVEDGIPEGGQAIEPTHDWERDYKALQAAYTQSQQSLKEWEDEQTALTRFAEKYPHLIAEGEEETPEEFFEPDPAEDPRIAQLQARIAALEPWQQQVETERGEARFQRDLKTELGETSVPKQAADWIRSRTAVLGDNSQALKQAVQEFTALADELRGPVRKAPPTPPQPGKAAELDRNASKDPNARRLARRAQIAAQIEAGLQ